MTKRKALGKGLSALISDSQNFEDTDQQFFQCPIEAIEPNPRQPRQFFSDEDLEEMVNSIKENGILTPLLVSRLDSGFRLIAGERRWRAAQKAGLPRVPVVVREAGDTELLELALIENIHRRDLNPIEEALAYKRLLEETGVTQGDIAKKLGKDRSTITNMLRLLKLPNAIQNDVINGRISMAHARVLTGLSDVEDQKTLRNKVIEKGLSVRQLERLVGKTKKPAAKKNKPRSSEIYFESITEDIKRSLGTKVEIKRQGKKGKMILYFYSDEEFERLLEKLT